MKLQISSQQIWLYSHSVDFRKSIDGLLYLVQTELKVNASEGLFLFYNRNKNKLKILFWHSNGFVLLYKRLERGKFTVIEDEQEHSVKLDEQQLSWLLAGLDWDNMRRWNELTYDDYY